MAGLDMGGRPRKVDPSTLDLKNEADMLKFVEISLAEQARISHEGHRTPDYRASTNTLAQKFTEILLASTLPTNSQEVYSQTFTKLNESALLWLEEIGGKRNAQMTNLWAGAILGEVNNHESLN